MGVPSEALNDIGQNFPGKSFKIKNHGILKTIYDSQIDHRSDPWDP
jgi:hypothetical protein